MKAKVITVSNNKGGTLKTSVVVNIAGALVKKGKKVLIIDVDPQGNCAYAFNYLPDELKYTLYDYLFEGEKLEKVIKKDIAPGLDMIPAASSMNLFETEVLKRKFKDRNFDHTGLFKPLLKELSNKYDYIFVDTPPNFGLIIPNIFNITDKIIVPIVLEKFSIYGFSKLFELIKDLGFDYKSKILFALPTRTEKNTLHQALFNKMQEIAKAKGIKMIDLENSIPKEISSSKSYYELGLPIIFTGKKTKSVVSYNYLADLIIKEVK